MRNTWVSLYPFTQCNAWVYQYRRSLFQLFTSTTSHPSPLFDLVYRNVKPQSKGLRLQRGSPSLSPSHRVLYLYLLLQHPPSPPPPLFRSPFLFCPLVFPLVHVDARTRVKGNSHTCNSDDANSKSCAQRWPTMARVTLAWYQVILAGPANWMKEDPLIINAAHVPRVLATRKSGRPLPPSSKRAAVCEKRNTSDNSVISG